MSEPQFLDRGDGIRLAFRHAPGTDPAIVYLPGYTSEMASTKATAVAAWAARRGRASLRLDYSGCGLSEGDFAEGTIGRWTTDALAVIDAATLGPVTLVASSMGGWIGLLIAIARPKRVTGLVLVAPAPDFTQWGLVDTLSADERGQLARTGRFTRDDAPGYGPTLYSRALIDEAGAHLLLGRPLAYAGPVRILHGQADADTPWRLSLDIAEKLASDDVRLTLIKDGEHRLSRPRDLALLEAALASL